MVLGEGAKMSLLGVAIGVGAGFALTHLMGSMLFGISSHDPLTFVAVAFALIAVAILASYIPAWRAAKVDPMIATAIRMTRARKGGPTCHSLSHLLRLPSLPRFRGAVFPLVTL
jgi:hypothetical protein